jgi:hypothetical protein
MNYVLVAGGYGMSRFLDLTDKKTANLFADGAGAAMLGVGDAARLPGEQPAGQGGSTTTRWASTRRRVPPLHAGEHGRSSAGRRWSSSRSFPTFNTDYWPKLMQGALDKAGLTLDDIDHYLFTQLNLRTIEAMMELIGSRSKTHWVMDKWGYTGSPCVIMALDDAIANGKRAAAGRARSCSVPAAAASAMARRSGAGCSGFSRIERDRRADARFNPFRLIRVIALRERTMYIGDYLARRELYSPDRLAIIDSGEDAGVAADVPADERRANRLANWLRDAAGVGKGDRVAILAHDGVEHLDTFFACGKLGAIHTALNWRLHPQELAGIVANTTPKVLIFSDNFQGEGGERCRRCCAEARTLSRTICTRRRGLRRQHPL